MREHDTTEHTRATLPAEPPMRAPDFMASCYRCNRGELPGWKDDPPVCSECRELGRIGVAA